MLTDCALKVSGAEALKEFVSFGCRLARNKRLQQESGLLLFLLQGLEWMIRLLSKEKFGR